ncbi:MAG: hypothetical protein ACAI25_20760 [Planctomycetota bacterium]
MSEKIDDLIARALPKIAAQGKIESFKRKIAKFAARAWVKGPDKLASYGARVPGKVHAAALEAAEMSEDDDEGGFLDDVRKAFKDDEAFVVVVKSLAKAYAAVLAKKKESAAETGAVKRRASSRRAKIVVDEEEAKPAKKKADPPGAISESGSGEDAEELPSLEIPDEDDGPKHLGIRMDDEEERAPPPKPSKSKKDSQTVDVKKKKGEFKRVELEEEPGEIELLAPPTSPLAAAAPAPKVVDADEGPDAAASRSIERFKKDGDPDELANARKLYKVAAEQAKVAPAKAAARAGVALTSLLAGQDEEARKLAEKALADDALCALAISVLARAKRGEGSREKLKTAIARARNAWRSGDPDRVAEGAAALSKDFPQEPYGKLIEIALAAESGNGVDTAVAAAWKHYPSAKNPDLALGEPLDARVARSAAAWGAQELERGGTDALIQTQRKLEEKDNVLAGAFQIALGLGRCALATRTDLTKAEEQELRTVCGEALLGLQYFDAAAATFDKAFSIDRNSGFAMECKKGTERSQVMRRAFDKPGVKARLGSFDGVGTAAMKKAVGARVAQAMTEKEQEESALLKDELEAVKALLANPDRRAKLEQRARKGGKESPFAPLEQVEQQVQSLEAEKQALGKEPAEKKGFFGRALDKVKDTAKTAQLAVKKQMAESKLAEAHKACARKLRDAPDDGWGDPVLDALAKRGAAVDAKLEHLEDELLQAKKAVAKIGEL